MKTLLKTLLWLVVLVAVGTGIGRAYVLRFWNDRDSLLKQQVMSKLHDLLPNVQIELDEIRYDFGREITLTGFSLTPNNQSIPLLSLPEVVIHIDRDALIERQQLDIRKVVVRQPTLTVVRDRDGLWNWQSMLPLPQQSDASLPEFVLEDGAVSVRVEQALGIPAGALDIEHVDVHLLPSGKRQFLIRATSRCEHTGGIQLTGRWHIDQHTGQLDGRLTQITAGQELVGVAASFVPDVRTKLAEWEGKLLEVMTRPPTGSEGSPFSLTPANGVSATEPTGARDSILGLKATFSLAFRVTRPDTETAPVFRVATKITDGEITNPILPFPLRGLTGELHADNERFTIKDLIASNDQTTLQIDGTLEGHEAGFPGRIKIDVLNVVCDQRLRSRLSAGFGRIYDQHCPRGNLDLHCFIVHDGGRWKPEELLVEAKDCSIIHEAFPYPIEHANGSIRQVGHNLIINAAGMAGSRPITLHGEVTDPGPNVVVQLVIETNNLPIDETFLKACKPDIQSAIRKMRLTGLLDGTVRLTKAPGRPFVPIINARLQNGVMAFESFAYRVDGISGKLTGVGTNFQFDEITGRHGSAKVAAKGSFNKLATGGEVRVRIITENAPLDASLRDALPPKLRAVWRELSPTGTIDSIVTDVHWLTGREADIRMPTIEWSKGSLQMKCLPYQLTDVRGSFGYGPGPDGMPTLNFKSFEGRHGEMRTSAKGRQLTEKNGDWRVKLDSFLVENLTPNAEFLKSLDGMPSVKQVFSSIDSNHAIRMEGVVELRGTPDPADGVTAAWDIDTEFFGSTILTGLDFKDLRGQVTSKGSWDGENAVIQGQVDLDSAQILDYKLAQIVGPFRVERGVLMFGSADTGRVRPPTQMDVREQLRAKLFGGNVVLGGRAVLAAEPRYQVLIQLQDCLLERFAALHAPKQKEMRGIANGYINLNGNGSSARAVQGNGSITVAPASLLSVPVVLQLYRGLSLSPPQNESFKYARFDFDVLNAKFLFKRIDLQSESVSFSGSGTVSFDGLCQLDFASRLPRSLVPIPLLHELLDKATEGVVGIEVTGKLTSPNTRVKPFSQLDDTLKILFNPALPIGQGRSPKRS